MDKTPSIQKLTTTNYITWKEDIQSLLGYHELNSYLTTDPPTVPLDATETHHAALDKYNTKTFKALSILRLYMDASEKQIIRSAVNAKEAWNILRERHERKSIARTLMLRRKLYFQTKIGKGGVAAYISNIQSLVDELNNSIVPVSDGELMIIMLLTLPEEYDAVTTVLQMKKPEELTIALIKNALLEQETKITTTSAARKEEKDAERALKAAADARRRRNLKCTNCNKIGHLIDRCWAQGGGAEGKGPKKGNADNSSQKSDGNSTVTKKKETAKLAQTKEGTRTPEFALTACERALKTKSVQNDYWIIDSGATKHMTNNIIWLKNYRTIDSPIMIGSAESDNCLQAIGIGEVLLECEKTDSNENHVAKLENVLYVPKLQGNLISCTMITQRGYHVLHSKDNCRVFDDDDRVILTASLMNNLWILNGKTIIEGVPEVAMLTRAKPSNELVLWHQRFGHVNEVKLRAMVKTKSVDGLNIPEDDQAEYCEPCAIEKATQLPFKKKRKNRALKPLDVIHIDLKGPIHVEEGCGDYDLPKYQFKPLDEATGFQVGYTLYHKSEAFEYLKQYAAMAENHHERKIKKIVCDGGGEFTSNEMKNWCKEKGILLDITPPRTPELNGIAERSNRTINESMNSMLNQAKMSKLYWPYAFQTAVYLMNRTITVSGKKTGKTPYEQWFKRKPDVSNLRVFGCDCVYYLHKSIREKGEGRGRKGRMIGYATKGYMIEEYSGRVIVSRHVTFNENLRLELFHQPEEKLDELMQVLVPKGIDDSDGNTDSDNDDEIEPMVDQDYTDESADNQEEHTSTNSDSGSEYNVLDGFVNEGDRTVIHHSDSEYATVSTNENSSNDNDSGSTANSSERRENEAFEGENDEDVVDDVADQNEIEIENPAPLINDDTPVLRRSMRVRQQPRDFWVTRRTDDGENALLVHLVEEREMEKAYVVLVDDSTSKTIGIKEAMSRDDWPMFQEAIKKEWNSIQQNLTWSLKNRDELPSNTPVLPCQWILTIKRNADGSIERYKARLVIFGNKQIKGIHYFETFAPVVRHTSLLALIALATARNWIMKQFDVETAFITCPLEKEDGEIYMELPKGFEIHGKVALLLKALYGLKQAPRLFHMNIRNNLKKIGFKQLESDPCVFIYDSNTGTVIIGIHVDDGSLFASNQHVCDLVEMELGKNYKTKIMNLSYILGMTIWINNELTAVFHQTYYDDILKRFNMENIKPRSTPHIINLKLVPAQETNLYIPNYRGKVGSLMYTATQVRPDVLTAVGDVARYCNNPDETHEKAVDQVFHYLAGTKDLALVFNRTIENATTLYGYVDANWGEDLVDRKSITGYVFLLCGSAISWKSKRQDTVARSTMEAEYMALSDCASEAMFLRQLLGELQLKQENPTIIYEDNDTAKGLAEERKTTQRSKHIDIKYHYVRELIEKKEIVVKRVESRENCADILTKGVARFQFEYLRQKMGLKKIKMSASGSVELSL